MKTITRADLADSVYEEIGFSRVESAELVDAVIDEMENAIIEEGELKLSSFGTFSVRQKKARVGRNPKTKVEVTITPRKVVTYKASHVLKENMNS